MSEFSLSLKYDQDYFWVKHQAFAPTFVGIIYIKYNRNATNYI